MELALKLFLVILASELVNLFGKTVLVDLAYGIYQTVVQGPQLSANRALKKETLEAKLELDRTSSQDEFARWAKLRRKLDKLVAELEKSNASLTSTKATFASTMSSALWFLTTGAQFILVWWYRSSAVFYLPKGYLPGPVGWWFSLPFAPKGSISSAAWSMVCKRTIKSSVNLAKDLFGPSKPVSAQNFNSPFPNFPPPPAGATGPSASSDFPPEEETLRRRTPAAAQQTAADLKTEDLD